MTAEAGVPSTGPGAEAGDDADSAAGADSIPGAGADSAAGLMPGAGADSAPGAGSDTSAVSSEEADSPRGSGATAGAGSVPSAGASPSSDSIPSAGASPSSDSIPSAGASPSSDSIPSAGASPSSGSVRRGGAGAGATPGLTFEAESRWRRGRVKAEIAIVLSLSLGASAVYSIVSLVNKATTPQGVAGQVSRLNTSLSDRPIFDLIYQVLAVVFDFAPVALVLFLLWEPSRSAFRRLGFDFARWRTDLRWVGLLILAIGIPGLAFFGVSRLLGLNAAISTNGLSDYWWTPLILILRALDAGVVEEVIVVGYLFTRLRELSWKPWAIILTGAALRGSYHLYQGYGAFVGNFVMGIAFGLLYQRYGRVMPLVIAHTIFDVIAFLGYPLALLWFPGVFA